MDYVCLKMASIQLNKNMMNTITSYKSLFMKVPNL